MRQSLTLLFLLIALSFATFQGVLAQSDHVQRVFTVNGIEINIAADNAVEARQSAIKQAQVKAFQQLSDKLLLPAEYEKVSSIDESTIVGLVRDFSIENERTAPTQYKASFSVRFDPNGVKNLFKKYDISFSAVAGGDVLVLPFLQIGQRFILWQDPNPWREIWFEQVFPDNLIVPIRLPVGDVEDLRDVPDNFLDNDNVDANVSRMKLRYGVDKVLAVSLKSNGAPLNFSKGGTIRVFQFFDGLPIEIGRVEDEGALPELVDRTITFIQRNWRQRVNVKAGSEGTFLARIFYSDIKSWHKIKQRIEEVPAIDNIELDELTKQYANVKIRFSGDMEQIFNSFQQTGLFLSRTSILDGQYHILKEL